MKRVSIITSFVTLLFFFCPFQVIAESLPCDNIINKDALAGIVFETLEPAGQIKHEYGCRIVNSHEGYPVYDGSQSVRFEVRPDDCGHYGIARITS